MPKVLMLLSNPYRPDPRVQREAKALSEAGYDMTIAAWDRQGKHPEEEMDSSVKLVRFGPSNDPKGFKAMASGLPKFWKNVRKWEVEREWDIIHAHDLDTLPLGLKLSKKTGARLIYDAHELYAEMVKEDVPGIIYKWLSGKEKRLAVKADHIITVNDAIAQVIRDWGAKEVDVVMNCPSGIQGGKESGLRIPNEVFSALYVGVLEPIRKLEDLVAGMKQGKAPDVSLYIGGFGSIEEKLRGDAGENTFVLGKIPSAEVPDLSRQSDVLIALYDPAYTNNRLGAPNKLFEAMAYGKPVIVAKGSWAGDVVEKEGCGMAVEYTGDAVFEALLYLKDNPDKAREMGENGLKAATERYNWNVVAEKLVSTYSFIPEGNEKMSRLRRSIFILVHNIKYPGFSERFAQAQNSEKMSARDIKEYQEGKLVELINFVYRNVPYYTRVFNERGLKPRDITNLEDLQKLPILTKDIIRKNAEDLKPKNLGELEYMEQKTGGSTGDPLFFRISKKDITLSWAMIYTHWGRMGYRMGDKVAVLKASSLVSPTSGWFTEFTKKMAINHIFLSAFDMTEKGMRNMVLRMKHFKPKYLYGYASALYAFAKFINEEDVDKNSVKLNAVFSTSEILFPFQREALENAFGCKVLDQYGLHDGGVTAAECEEHHGMHIDTLRAVMEFTDNSGKQVSTGKEGKILATDLYNFAMPFIRYDTGDSGVLSPTPCKCGRGLPLMEALAGRITNNLHFKDGSTLPGAAVVHLFRLFPRIAEYQVVQKSLDDIVVSIVKGEEYTDKDEKDILMTLQEHMNDIRITFKYVNNIPPSGSGKWKYIIQEMKI